MEYINGINRFYYHQLDSLFYITGCGQYPCKCIYHKSEVITGVSPCSHTGKLNEETISEIDINRFEINNCIHNKSAKTHLRNQNWHNLC